MYHLYHDEKMIFSGTIEQLKRFIRKESRGREIYCWNTGERFSSIKKAAMTLNLDASQLGKHLRREPSYKEVKGYTFSFWDTATQQPAKEQI